MLMPPTSRDVQSLVSGSRILISHVSNDESKFCLMRFSHGPAARDRQDRNREYVMCNMMKHC